MSARCLGPECEGWELSETDRFCPNCGLWQYPVALSCPSGPVMDVGPVRLRVDFQGHYGWLDLTELEWPSWMRAEAVPARLEPGQSLDLELQVSESRPEGLPGLIRLGMSQLEVWSSPPAQCQLVWDTAPVNPEHNLVRGWLQVDSGALWVSELPPGWSCSQTLPLVLSQRSRPRLELWAPAVRGPLRWELNGRLLESHLEFALAGQLELPERLEWCLTSSTRLRISVRSQGLVEIERIDSPLELAGYFPARLEGEGELWVEPEHTLPAPGLSWLEVVLRDGRHRRIWLDIVQPERTDYEGWLLIDLGSTTCTAALLDGQGHLTQLNLDGHSLELPSGLAYFAGRPPEPTRQAAANVVLQAKRHLGLPDFRFRLVLPDTQELLEKTPEQVLADYLAMLLGRVAATPQLARHRLRKVCLAHPAAFSPRQIQLLRQAMAGQLDCQLELISEPLAAAYDFLAGRSWPEREWRLLLYDFGGTTSDVALLKVDSRRSSMVKVELEHVGGDRWFGGNDVTELQAQLLPPEQRPRAEQIKCQHTMRAQLDPLVEPRLRLSLPEGPVRPDLIVLSGQGSLYPLIPEWLQKQFPGVPLERAARPKHCVVLGSRHHPEVVRSGPPRSLTPGQAWLAFPENTGATVCTTRLGVKLLGERGARFHPLVGLGQALPCTAELTPVSLLPGENYLEVVENLGWEVDYVLPDGSLNSQLVTLDKLKLQVSGELEPAFTCLRWALSADYRLFVRVENAGRSVLEVGPFTLWPE
ncbi:Hsp70 family protein [bacterium]|nr:Hsp70 family protein [bacterium]